jgi:Xaa-Pro aminopeptidase
MEVRARLAALRAQMRVHKVDAYFVPNADPHQSEYAPECWNRRAWLSGFTGSAGDVLVGLDAAWLWTDGRYFLQAETQLRNSAIEMMRQGVAGVPSVEEQLQVVLSAGSRLGVDPRVVSPARAKLLGAAVARAGASLAFVDCNLVDAIWVDQPATPASEIKPLATRFAGESLRAKLRRIRTAMRARDVDAHVLTTLDAIAWIYNIRAADVQFNPVAVAYAVVTHDDAVLFTDQKRVTAGLRRHFAKHVSVADYADVAATLENMGAAGKRVWVDDTSASQWVLERLHGARPLFAASPVALMKAKKNATELKGIRAAHVRDGVAMVRFLHWLERIVATGQVSEMSAAQQLEAYRAEGEHFQGLSFPTIAGYGAHGAIIHYGVDTQSDVPLKPKGLFLLDSGAQYLDGTTDITRTLLLGARPRAAERDNFTRVLKGHIALAQARFPAGATGARLDTLARQFLWQAGLDYAHGTGHGVGAYLNVHEGPQSISPRAHSAPLEAGNVQSNEPGYYEPGQYGIRIENLVEVARDDSISAPGREFLCFRTLTVCPIDTRLVALKLMSKPELQWLNSYHAHVRKTLSPLLSATDRRWLVNACKPI